MQLILKNYHMIFPKHIMFFIYIIIYIIIYIYIIVPFVPFRSIRV